MINVLIINDIDIVAKEAANVIKNSNALGEGKAIPIYIKVGSGILKNILNIKKQIGDSQIQAIAVHRKYRETIDKGDGYIKGNYSVNEIDLLDLLTGKNGLLTQYKKNNFSDLKRIIIHTYIYDTDEWEIDKIKKNVKDEFQIALNLAEYENVDVDVYETSYVFNRPLDPKPEDPDFLFLPKNEKESTREGKIGTNKALKEYGSFIGSLIRDLILGDTANINSYAHHGNREFETYLRMLERLHIRELDEVRPLVNNQERNQVKNRKSQWFPGTVSVFIDFYGKPEILIDLPYKEYYSDLNKELEDQGLFKFFEYNKWTNNRSASSKQGDPHTRWVFYDYDFDYINKKYILRSMAFSGEQRNDLPDQYKQNLKCYAQKWLPFLHGSAFHYADPFIWKDRNVESDERNEYVRTNNYNLFFLLDTIKIDEYVGTINYTFYRQCDCKLTYAQSKDIAEIFLDVYGFLLKSKATQELIPRLKALALQQATRAAIAQVMTRNLSHNIGSHVLSKFKNKNDIEAIFILDNKYPKSSNAAVQYTGFVPAQEPIEQLASFNEYLKSRMDFLADITMATPIMETSHRFCSGVMDGFLRNPILLNRISGISGVDAPKYNIKNFITSGGKRKESEYNLDSKKWIRDSISVAMPNDVLGRHAFYVIMENIIRNSYKHSSRVEKLNDNGSSCDEFKFSVELAPCNEAPDFVRVRVYDNAGRSKSETSQIVFKRNEVFKQKLIINGMLRSGGLGTIEIEVCAAYLRKIPLEIYDNELYSCDSENVFKQENGEQIPCLVHAYSQPLAESDLAALGYEFYLLKPRELLILEEGFIPDAAISEEWNQAGVEVIDKLKESKSYAHQILLTTQEITPILNHTQRIIKISSLELEEYKSKTSKEAINDAWELWGRKIIENRCYKFIRGRQDFTFPLECMEPIMIEFHNHEPALGIGNYIETSHHSYKKLDFRKPNSRQMAELAEMANTKICIIDERVQSFALYQEYEGTGKKMSYFDYFNQIDVHMPSETEANLNVQDFFEAIKEGEKLNIKDKICAYIHSLGTNERDTWQRHRKKDWDFIVIHLGILEKMLHDNKKGNKVRELIIKLVGEKAYPKVVLTSGRGTPETVPGDCRYLPLSVLQHCIETAFDKQLLVQALYNTRATNKQQ